MPILHLQKCKNSNPLMENRVWKGQISRIFASLFPNYGRKSHDSGRDIHPFMGRDSRQIPDGNAPQTTGK